MEQTAAHDRFVPYDPQNPENSPGDSSTSGDEEEEVDRLEVNIRALKEELRTKEGLAEDQESQKTFIDKYGDSMRPQNSYITNEVEISHRNLLYIMAKSSSKNQNHPWLVKYLVNSYTILLQEHDKGNDTALFVAITRNGVEFVKAVLESNIAESKLQTIIASSGGRNENCIHAAIINDFDADTTVELIKRASPVSLGSKDDKQLTALHHAVEYARCTASRLSVVKALIQHSDMAFDQVTGKPDNFSVYQYHIHTQRQFTKVTPSNQEGRRPVRNPDHVTTQARLDDMKSQAAANVHETRVDRLQEKKLTNKKGTEMTKLRDSSIDRGTTGVKGREIGVSTVEQSGHESLSKSEQMEPITRIGSFGPGNVGTVQQSARTLLGQYQANEARQYVTPEAQPSGTRSLGPDATAFNIEGPKKRKEIVKRPRTHKTRKLASARSKDSDVKEPPSDEVAGQIARELKSHYLRSTFYGKNEVGGLNFLSGATPGRNHDSAVRFLFGDNREDKQICFFYPPSPPKKEDVEELHFEDFEKSYAGFKFDNVLQHVKFGHIKLTRSRRPGGNPDRQAGRGRRDIVKFFDWLHITKKVESIIKVTVEDRIDIPHSDEAIEAALNRFNVKILEWRKVDMDPKAIWTACQKQGEVPVLRELHLWWSGNNAILRAWSEECGLAKLPSLCIVHIYQEQAGLDSPARIEANFEGFRARLNQHRPEPLQHIKALYHSSEDHSIANNLRMPVQVTDADRRSQIDSHRWLEIMDRLADGIHTLEPPVGCRDGYLRDAILPPELRKEVKIALIDDGADYMNVLIAEKMDNGRSFGTSEPFHGSTTGHGTCMAYMMGRICPAVKIFVCKLDVLRHTNGQKASFTARSAADAVLFAVNREFDIISMSWTVERSQDDIQNIDNISRLEKALQLAKSKGKLVFCSAPDIGNVSNTVLASHYPVGCIAVSHGIFKIGAAKADGSAHGWTGDADMLDFLLPGHNVHLREGDRITEEDDMPKSGSSVATALAAGLAALLIHVVRLAAIYDHYYPPGPNAVGVETLRAIRTFDGMNQALATVNSRGRTVTAKEDGRRDRNFEVETFFNEPARVLQKSNGHSEEDRWKRIREMARDLVPFGTQASVTKRSI